MLVPGVEPLRIKLRWVPTPPPPLGYCYSSLILLFNFFDLSFLPLFRKPRHVKWNYALRRGNKIKENAKQDLPAVLFNMKRWVSVMWPLYTYSCIYWKTYWHSNLLPPITCVNTDSLLEGLSTTFLSAANLSDIDGVILNCRCTVILLDQANKTAWQTGLSHCHIQFFHWAWTIFLNSWNNVH